LRDHLVEVVGEYFERNRAIGYRGGKFPREGLVILDTSLAHQGRIGGEALDQWILVERQDTIEVGAVGEYLDVFYKVHGFLVISLP
jgi:hypothetical protein